MRSLVCSSFLVGALCAGCAATAGRMGEQYTRSALHEFQKQMAEVPVEQQGALAERSAAGAVRGMLDELSHPERQAQLSRALEAALYAALHSFARGTARSEEMGTGGSGNAGQTPAPMAPLQGSLGQQLTDDLVAGFMRRLEKELGPDGDGPLAEALASSTHRMASAAITGARAELTGPASGCTQSDPFECAKQRVHDLGSAAASGVVSGIRWWLLLGVFLLGLMFSAVSRELLSAIGGVARRRRSVRSP